MRRLPSLGLQLVLSPESLSPADAEEAEGAAPSIPIPAHTHESADGGILSIVNATSGTLPASRGGTSFTSYQTGDLLVGNAGGGLSQLGKGSAGEVLAVSGATIGWRSVNAISNAGNDFRYVNAGGDTMSGQLVVGLSSGTVGLKVLRTISGSTLHADTRLESSGSLVVQTTGLFKGNLTTRSTLSGSALTISSLQSCASLQTASNGAFACNTGLSQTALDARFVNASGDTMTGGLHIGAAGVGLNVTGTLSGNALTIMHGNSSFLGNVGIGKSGTPTAALDVVGIFSGSSLTISSLSTCINLQTASNGAISCNNTVYQTQTLSDARYVNTSGDTMTGALTIGVTNGTSTTIGLRLLNALGGAVLHAEKDLTSSGTLTVRGAATFGSTFKLNGVTYTFPTADGSASGKILATNAAGVLSWTSIVAAGGLNQTNADNRYLQKQGGTMTGACGSPWRGSASMPQAPSRVMHHRHEATATSWETSESGKVEHRPQPSMSWERSRDRRSRFRVFRVVPLQTSSAGAFSCNTGLSPTALDARYVNTSGDTMTGALTILKTSGTATGNTLAVDTKGLVYDASNKSRNRNRKS